MSGATGSFDAEPGAGRREVHLRVSDGPAGVTGRNPEADGAETSGAETSGATGADTGADTGAEPTFPKGRKGMKCAGRIGAGAPKLKANGPEGPVGALPGAICWKMVNIAFKNAVLSAPGAGKAGYWGAWIEGDPDLDVCDYT
ncbi:hypothetical protein NDU88_001462 [Pleurodeles waltl]|uniref:Uncharacterized protein n=1 Tax=Pleurodeles waltl TaxID=8319 RepID=A0AAV7P804_PLEWA|nr:hypothetical protein NDU88_001462 [Pleurodeles waltl]